MTTRGNASGRAWRLMFACLFCAVASVRGGDDGKAVQQERLAKYSFVRTEYEPGAIGLLVGNTELGGMADTSGLSIPQIWGADLWKDAGERRPVEGPFLQCEEFAGPFHRPVAYRQELGLVDGVLRTRALYGEDKGYEAELFCSMDNPHLLVFRVKNLGGKGERAWRVVWPVTGYTVTSSVPGLVTGLSTNQGLTSEAWAIRSSKPWTTNAEGREIVRLAPGESVTLLYSLTTQWDGPDYVSLCRKTVSEWNSRYNRLLKNHGKAWAALWRQSATLAIPDEALERMWYRSLFWTLSTCGSEHFLPGESMFGVSCWGMRPFTYGAAGWAVQAFTAAGFPGRAKAMLDWHFKPDKLRENAEFYTRTLSGKPASPDAWAFGHEVRYDGGRLPAGFWELQRHVDGFGASLFWRFNRLYPDEKFYRDTVYPVLRGTACSWQGLVSRDEKSGEFILPRMTSLTEDLSAVNLIDAALAAKWCLLQASRTASELKRDPELQVSWKELAGKLCIPQSKERYLEYFNDEEKRVGGGYQGIRGFVYLSYPTLELSSTVDPGKVIRTLDYTWVRNRHGDGMIGFVANWFALADTHYGRGEHALSVMRHNLKCLDRWDTSLSETPGNQNFYFTTGYASYILVPLSMVVQSSEGRISVFPAVPSEWKNFSFYNVPAESGIRVSGQLKDGEVLWVSYCRGSKELLRTTKKGVVQLELEGRKIRLVP